MTSRKEVAARSKKTSAADRSRMESGMKMNAQLREQLGVDTANTSENNHDITPIIDRIKATLLAGQSVRLIDYPPEDRQAVTGAVAALRDQLPIHARWVTVRESHLSQTRLRALRYWIPAEFLKVGVDHAN